MRTVYTLVLRALLPLILLRLWWRGRREPRYREALAERFGHYEEVELEESPAVEEHSIWIHAVSVGEARAAALGTRTVGIYCGSDPRLTGLYGNNALNLGRQDMTPSVAEVRKALA